MLCVPAVTDRLLRALIAPGGAAARTPAVRQVLVLLLAREACQLLPGAAGAGSGPGAGAGAGAGGGGDAASAAAGCGGGGAPSRLPHQPPRPRRAPSPMGTRWCSIAPPPPPPLPTPPPPTPPCLTLLSTRSTRRRRRPRRRRVALVTCRYVLWGRFCRVIHNVI
ncbi:hypothetical protein BU14_0130s0003 [Porphyra umbilicalis]|uniref:Uncharacterized protein n=1 Tax=Porphyra umbilicalis TaxID=2786 RepID=A0A1X6PAG4_PORUM|nr:hypothetical protein BU14_0130s0003 [Porphyra umbilicalis]|eukprot:OSX77848.1 hypothetical protein BU14_0130s0003 [Porphyra umbilicalis]